MTTTVEKKFSWEITSVRNKNGDLHCTEGPALKTDYGKGEWMYCWYLNGRKHRHGGPAEEYSDGRKWWYCSGKLSRLDGPAVVFPEQCYSVPVQYWVNGEFLTEEEHLSKAVSLVNIE